MGHLFHNPTSGEMSLSVGENTGGAHYLTFKAGNGSEKLRIDSSGRLLLGTTTEGNSSADNFTIADSTHCGITLRSGTSSRGAVYFSDATSGNDEFDGYLIYEHDNRAMRFATAATERLRIDSVGHMGLGKTPADTNSFTRALDISGTSGSALYARTNSSGSDFAVFGYYGKDLFVRENSGSGELRFQGGSSNRLVIKSTGVIDASMNTTAVALPTGTTAQRPSGTDAYIRKNSSNNSLEFYNGTEWVEIITDYFPTGSTILG